MNDAICAIPFCLKPRKTRGWCGAHYQRWLRTGDVQEGVPFNWSPGDRWKYFQATVYIVQDQCLIWPYATSNDYGVVHIGGRQYSVHVLACQAWHGPRPPGMEAGHGPCHRTRCYNGQHLSWITPGQNMKDQRRDGTAMLGAKNHATKLTSDQVLEIRAKYAAGGIKQWDLAHEYGMKQPAISSLLRRETWNHI